MAGAKATQSGGAGKSAPAFLTLFGFVGDSIVDGPGLRCAVFSQGCPHRCPGCHNPESHPFTGGTQISVEELYHRIKGYPLCRGVTFSGGEPFSQAEGFTALARLLKADGYELAAFTGYTFAQLQAGTPAQRELLSLLDTLVDGRYEESQRNLALRFRGSENQRILDVPQSLAAGEAVWTMQERWVGNQP